MRAWAPLLLLAVLLTCCTGGRGAVRADEAGFLAEGLASYYGPGLHGRPTASGEIFDRKALTAAHRRLPFGSCVRVRNVENGRQVQVRINDRGPFVGDRLIDVSEAAAGRLGMLAVGVARVRLYRCS